VGLSPLPLRMVNGQFMLAMSSCTSCSENFRPTRRLASYTVLVGFRNICRGQDVNITSFMRHSWQMVLPPFLKRLVERKVFCSTPRPAHP